MSFLAAEALAPRFAANEAQAYRGIRLGSVLARLALVLVCACACTVVSSPGPSAVSQAVLYRTGEPTYDQFFVDLHAQQSELGTATEREHALRAELALRSKSKDQSPGALAGKVRDKATELARAGTHLRVVADTDEEDEDSSARLEIAGPLPEADRPLIAAVERTARGELGLVVEMTRRQHELDRLAALADGLARSNRRVFGHVSLSRMHEVEKNLEDSRTLIALMKARSESTRMAARRMLKKLVRAAAAEDPKPTLPSVASRSSEPPPKTPSKPAEPRSRATGTPPKAGAPTPSKPAASPAPDFEP